ncbi:hypothetical protein [Gracilimonas sp.]|uniref:hypothetical protein n=1 Tax=Gracilimonas sp. TaxID=1974203 RepID=UPI0032EFFDA0
MSKELALSFRLVSIKTDEFAIIEDSFEEEGKVSLESSFNFRVDKEKHILGTTVKFQFEQNDKPFLIISVTCGFEMEEEAWESLIDVDNNKIIIPEGFASHMAVLTVGTARGVLHEKTSETDFSDFIIPPINLTKIITEDIEIELSVD